jgi:hypothetical protein
VRALAALLLAAVALLARPVDAARPLLDRHQWDAYFALFARDASVPWKPAVVRLDTYSGAPVDFAAYEVDPADVIVAGRNRSSRPLDTAHRRPVVRWRFAPPPGYRFESSDVTVPLGTREGFFVVEARRGDAVQQVWLNRTHIGLLTKESPEGLVVWCVDLRGGRALAGVSVSFLVGERLVVKRTNGDGAIVWRDRARPAFALAESGSAHAFVSTLPQAPLPAALVGVRVDSAVARAGGTVRFVGFVRKRTPHGYRRGTGDARVALLRAGKTLAATVAHVDAAGAFAGELAVPAGLDAGEYALLANAGGAVGGTTVHVDAAADVALTLTPGCPCDPERDVVLTVAAERAGVPAPNVPVRVEVVRTPHVVPPGSADDAPRWGTTVVFDGTVRTDAAGAARVTLGAPTDGLDSTYGVRATTRGASATSRIVVPNAKVALALEPLDASADVGQPIAFDVRGFDPTDGAPAAGVAVAVRLTHGASASEQRVTLDARGFGRVTFAKTTLGSNLALAQATVDGRRALDAAAVLVEPSALSGQTTSAEPEVAVAVDKTRYHPGDRIAVRASAPGASGDALVTLEGARTYVVRRLPVVQGRVAGTLDLGDPDGAVRVGVAVVRDGAIALGTTGVNVDAPGHERLTDVALDKTTYAPGEVLHATIADGSVASGATLAIRVADGRESAAAEFGDAADLLDVGATTAQTPSSADPEWHAYVAPARSKANDIFAAERGRKAPTEPPSLGAAAPKTLLWRVVRADGNGFDLPVPKERGHFVLSVLKISDDGDVGAALASFNVR